MTLPARVLVVATAVPAPWTPCLCSENEGFNNPATVKLTITAEDCLGQTLDGWSGVEYRCGDGADLVVDELKRIGRHHGWPVDVVDNTGLLDRDLVTHEEVDLAPGPDDAWGLDYVKED